MPLRHCFIFADAADDDFMPSALMPAFLLSSLAFAFRASSITPAYFLLLAMFLSFFAFFADFLLLLSLSLFFLLSPLCFHYYVDYRQHMPYFFLLLPLFLRAIRFSLQTCFHACRFFCQRCLIRFFRCCHISYD